MKTWEKVAAGAAAVGIVILGWVGIAEARKKKSATLQSSAVDMANALNAHGYYVGDVPVYKAFQEQAIAAGTLSATSGVNGGVDGWPGTKTMGALQQALSGTGVSYTGVVYPFTSWGPPNGPTYTQWTGDPNAGNGAQVAVGTGDAGDSKSG